MTKITQPSGRSILVVDDSRASRNAIGHELGLAGHRIVLCESGVEALDLIAGGGFDLVVLDLIMPELSGMRVLAEIRSARDSADLPVVMVSARDDSASMVDALAAGADDYVVKPYPPQVMSARVERALARAERINALKRANAVLDARLAIRAVDLGEAVAELAAMRAQAPFSSGTSAGG